MPAHPLVTVVVPCYNYGHFLPDTLESLRRQSYQAWECLVVDDGSQDETRAITEQFARIDSRFKYFYQQNNGMSSARNVGIREAKGVFIQFLDADDLLDPDKLEMHASYLISHPEIDIVYGDWGYFDRLDQENAPLPVDPQRQPWTPRVSGQGAGILNALLRDNMLAISAPLVRKALLERFHGFDETIKAHEDWDLWLNCALVGGRFHYLHSERARALIRLHCHSVSRNTVLMHETNIAVRSRIQSALQDASLRALNHRGMREVGVLLAGEKIRRGEYLRGFFLLSRCCLSRAGLAKLVKIGVARFGK